MALPQPLTAEQIATELANLDGWTGDTDQITKTYQIEYHAAVRMIVDVARTAKNVGHHPDIDLRWANLRFTITTHDADNQVTLLDIDLAQRIDTIATQHGVNLTDD